MIRGLSLLFFLFACRVFSGVQTLPALPPATGINSLQLDASQNIYVAGEYFQNPSSLPAHAFVGKLSPDGAKIIWWTQFAGSADDRAMAIALGSDNSVYVTGGTLSTDFPTTKGSLQPTTTIASGQGFAAKLSPSGAVVYSTYIGGSAITGGHSIAVDSSGDAFITGFLNPGGGFPTSPGAVSGVSNTNQAGYVIELNPSGSAAPVAIAGFGGSSIALDAQGNIYVAGTFVGPIAPVTPGAFQPTAPAPINCFSSISLGFSCTSQHIAKIDPTGTKLVYATYLTGSYGAIPRALAVDAAGNLIVAGSTNSPDYPTTPAAYQPEFFGFPLFMFEPPHSEAAPGSAGFVTKLNASGSGLIWSTLFAGTATTGDSIYGMAIDGTGNIVLAGAAASTDLPGLWSTPVASRTGPGGLGFVTRLSADGTTLSPTQLIPGSATVTGIAARSDGSVLAASAGLNVPSGGVSGASLSAVTIGSVGRVAAISDTADSAKIVRVAPGQLLTLYGTNLAPSTPVAGLPTTANGVTVTFNGIAAPILYTSGIQINLQVPYEIAGLTEVTMLVSSTQVTPAVSESYFLAVTDRQPSVFLSSNNFSQPLFDLSQCNGQSVAGLQPLALNADGTLNSCASPAPSGSTVTIFLNGLGISAPMQGTGVISASAVPISPAAGFASGTTAGASFLSTKTLPGSIDGIAQVQIQVSSTGSPFLVLPLGLQPGASAFSEGFWVRGPSIVIWVKSAN